MHASCNPYRYTSVPRTLPVVKEELQKKQDNLCANVNPSVKVRDCSKNKVDLNMDLQGI